MSDCFLREVYGVVRDVPAGKVISYGEIASLLGNAAMLAYGREGLETGSFRFESALSSGGQCTGKTCSRMGKNSVCYCRRRAFVSEKMEMWIWPDACGIMMNNMNFKIITD